MFQFESEGDDNGPIGRWAINGNVWPNAKH